jgi:hypothetical protein
MIKANRCLKAQCFSVYFVYVIMKDRNEHRLNVFEDRAFVRISGPKRDEVTGGWSKLHNEELHGLHSSSNVTRMIKARGIKWSGHVACIEETEVCKKFCLQILKLETTQTIYA